MDRHAYVKGEQKTISNQDYKGKWHVLYCIARLHLRVSHRDQGFQRLLDDFGDDKSK